jgi:hypothetical protein
MTPRLSILTLAAFAGASGFAQNVRESPQPDPILEAIQEFNNRDKEATNEITVVLDAPDDEPPAWQTEEEASTEAMLAPTEESAIAADELIEEITAAEEPAEPEGGLAVRVESLQTGEGALDASQVKLLAPFPAKPIAPAPEGWLLDPSDSAPPFTREVEISPGAKITLSIRPHLLIPEADGTEVFSISEPGYEAQLGYQQAATVSAILGDSVAQLEDDSIRLGVAIDQLHQLLSSLPQPEPETTPSQRPKP